MKVEGHWGIKFIFDSILGAPTRFFIANFELCSKSGAWRNTPLEFGSR
jgi:hypothetical protein